jgi:hypothetical protein
MSLIVEALLNLSSYLRIEQILIDSGCLAELYDLYELYEPAKSQPKRGLLVTKAGENH